MGVPYLYSDIYWDDTVFTCLWYGSCPTSWDRSRISKDNSRIPNSRSGIGESLIWAAEKRLKALYHVQEYQRRIVWAFNKKVKSRNLKEGNLVLKELRAPVFDPKGKFKPNWAEPYVIKILFSGGAAKLMDMDGEELFQPVILIDCVSITCKK